MNTLPTTTLTPTSTVPIVGFTVWWSLSGIRVPHAQLEEAAHRAGFAAYLPSPPTHRKALRRALEAWIRERTATSFVGEEDGEEAESATRRSGVLIRTINQPRSKWMVFALVAEDQNLAALGLSYATALRILLDKEAGGMVVTSEGRGLIEQASDLIEAAGGGVTVAEAEARQVAQELLPHWRHYRDLHISGDLSRMVREIVCGELVQRTTRRGGGDDVQKPGLGAVTVRGGGGLYFVPAEHQAALERLRAMIEALPTDGRHAPYFVMQPVLDEQAAKGHLARAAHAGFLDEIAALQADLERIAQSKSPSQEAVADRLATYKATMAKLDTYTTLLGMQQEWSYPGFVDTLPLVK